MLKTAYLRGIDFSLGRARGAEAEPFGGALMVLMGDSYQLAPVCESEADSVRASPFASLQQEFGATILTLDEPRRHKDVQWYAELKRIALANGEISVPGVQVVADWDPHWLWAWQDPPSASGCKSAFQHLQQRNVLNDLRIAQLTPSSQNVDRLRETLQAMVVMSQSHVLGKTNREAHDINDKTMRQLAGSECRLSGRSFAALGDLGEVEVTGEIVSLGSLPREQIVLRLGQLAHVTVNFPGHPKYTKVLLTRCSPAKNSISFVKFSGFEKALREALTPTAIGGFAFEEISLPRFVMKKSAKGVDFSVEQFAVEAPWALTVHKSQGKTVHRVYVLNSEASMGFTAHGLCYVALSRTREKSNIRIWGRENLLCRSLPELDILSMV
jgi:hypothetical protein